MLERESLLFDSSARAESCRKSAHFSIAPRGAASHNQRHRTNDFGYKCRGRRNAKFAAVTDANTKRAALGYAAALLSSLNHAAAHLGLEPDELRILLRGDGPVPDPLFLKALELLMAAKAAELAAARRVVQESRLPQITPDLDKLLSRS